MKLLQLLVLVFVYGVVTPSCAQGTVTPVTTEEKKEVIDSITSILESNYVFPEVAVKMNTLLQENLQNNAYDGVNDPNKFAELLTEDIRSVSKDLHLRVRFDPENIARRRNARQSAADSIALVERRLRNNRQANYGFREVRILDGNIGYLNLTGFFGVSEEAGATAQAAMNFLSNADALIIDLRQNGGGSPSMIQLITSYLYGPERVHLNNFYDRSGDSYTQTWTLPYVPGKRRPDMDVYVLTSNSTFSAAEEFSYNLRNQERATIIGEVTGGGAHPGGTRIATDRFTIWVPDGRAINPISNTNWEGVGVEPHIKVAANEALEVAKITALETILKRTKKEDAFHLEWALSGYKAAKEPVEVNERTLKSYAGKYGPRKLAFRDGVLYYQREGNTQYKLIPMAENQFRIEEVPYFRIRMLSDRGRVVALEGMYRDGRIDKSLRSAN